MRSDSGSASLGLAGEGLVQQMIEDAPRRLGLVVIIAQESGARIRAATVRERVRLRFLTVAALIHAQGQLAQLVVAFGQAMRLQIEQQLQPMLDLAQKAIGVVEDAIFLIGQAADSFQGGQGEQRVALANFRQIAAVEELQKLDGELDVADAAAAGLDLACR